MFKKFIVFLTLVLTVFLPYTPIIAQGYGVEAFSKGAGYDTNKRDIYAIVDMAVSAFLSIIAIILFIIVFYGGVLWMTAQGNDEKVQKAKDLVQSAAIGLVIVLASYGITYFVFNKLVGS